MTPPDPFAYPAAPHARLHAPAGYLDYRSYKPWLRDEFAFRCAYCLTREGWSPSEPGHALFGADHIVPQSGDPASALSYSNLVYACGTCNSYKQAGGLPLGPLDAGYGHHIRPLTAAGRDLIGLFRPASPGRTRQRVAVLALIRAKQTHPADPDIDALYRRAFGYPADLPDLAALRPPGGNALPDGEAACHHARRGRGELAATY